MLVFNRTVGEEVVLPSRGVTIAIVAVSERRVRLGITASPDTTVRRQDVWRPAAARQSTPPEADGKPVRVLIADADRAVSLFYRDALAAKGLDVEAASNAQDCIRRLLAGRPQVLVLDPAVLQLETDEVRGLVREASVGRAVPILLHAPPGWRTRPEDEVFPVCARESKPLAPERMACVIRQLANGVGRLAPPPLNGDVDWQSVLMRGIAARTHGQVRGLRIEIIEGRLIVHGQSRSYYGKQLACAAVLDLTRTLAAVPFDDIELDIEVLG